MIKIVARFWCLYCRVVWVFMHVKGNLRSIRKGLGIRAEDLSGKQCKSFFQLKHFRPSFLHWSE